MGRAAFFRRYPAVAFFGLAWGITWGTTLLLNSLPAADPLGEPSLPAWAIVIGTLGLGGPSLAGLIMAGFEKGRRGLGDVLRWYAVALLGPALLAFVSVGIYVLAGGSAPDLPGFREAWYFPLVVLLFTLPFNEEFGWRAYALPRFQASYGPAAASVLIGLGWGLWHLPALFEPAFGLRLIWFVSWPMVVGYLGLTVAQSVTMTWLFNRAGGSALIGGFLAHAAINTWNGVVLSEASLSAPQPRTPEIGLMVAYYATAYVTALALLVATRGRLGYVSSVQQPPSGSGKTLHLEP